VIRHLVELAEVNEGRDVLEAEQVFFEKKNWILEKQALKAKKENLLKG